MKVMILGASGQLGSEFRFLENFSESLSLHFYNRQDLDISSKKLVRSFLRNNKFDIIINCAAYTDVDEAENNFNLAKSVNADAIEYFCEYLEQTYTNTVFIHISTDYIFDGNFSKPIVEEDVASPISKYGESKLMGERYLQNSSVPSLIIRVSWLYSIFGKNFMKTIINLGETKDKIHVINDQIGSPTSAYDLAMTIIEIINSKKFLYYANNKEIFNFSNSGSSSWCDFATEILRLSGSTCSVLPISSNEYPSKAKRPNYSVLDSSKAVSAFDLDINSWQDALSLNMKKLNSKANNQI
tara:strand:+ start:5242 stop:6135 length:894 start_codon:yes stop_codon:yes gene_type:complete